MSAEESPDNYGIISTVENMLKREDAQEPAHISVAEGFPGEYIVMYYDESSGHGLDHDFVHIPGMTFARLRQKEYSREVWKHVRLVELIDGLKRSADYLQKKGHDVKLSMETNVGTRYEILKEIEEELRDGSTG